MTLEWKFWIFLFSGHLGVCLCIQEGPTFVKDLPARVFFPNSEGVVLPCGAKGHPTPSITWLNAAGARVIPVAGVLEVLNGIGNSSLKLFPFRPEQYRQDLHVASYRCRASNTVGTVLSGSMAVQAVVLQHFEVGVSDTRGQLGGVAAFTCDVPPMVARHVKVIKWIMDGRIFKPSLYPDGRFWALPSGELVIRNLAQSDAYAHVSCVASHEFDPTPVSSNVARVIISGEGSMLLRPQLLLRREWLRSEENSDLLLPCVVSGHPQPSVTWFKEDETRGRIPLNLNVGGRVREVEGQLIFSPIRREDPGVYLCVANNSAGTESYRVEISVRNPLHVTVKPPFQRVDLNQPAILTCEVDGRPVASISWYKDGKQLSQTPRVNVFGKSLHISHVSREDGGMYQCIVKNEEDSAQGTTQLDLGDSVPVIDYRFISQTLQPGPSVSLKCVASGSPSPQFTWNLDGFPLPQNERIAVGQYVSVGGAVVSHVNISDVRSEDGGSYSCMAENTAGNTVHAARLNVYGPAYIRPMPIVTAVAGESLFLSCPASGYPLEKISWERDGRVLPLTARQMVHENGTLVIKKVQKTSDGGRYTCTAQDKQGRAHSATASVQVLVPPTITPFVFGEASDGERIQVVCSIRKGDPPFSIAWLKDGRPLDDGPAQGVQIRPMDQYSNSLLLEQVRESHSGNYTCQATNAAQSVSYSASLSVKVPPSWLVPPRDTSAILGETVEIPCQAKGFPEPRITWRKSIATQPGQYTPVLSVRESGRSMRPLGLSGPDVALNGSLLIIVTSEQDEGQFLCEAANGVGGGLSSLVTLVVHAPPKFEDSFNRQQNVRRGASVTLECQAKGDSPIRMEWMKENQVIHARSVIREIPGGVKGELTISSAVAKDAGIYICLAENEFGRDSYEIHVIIQDVPSAPYGLRVDERNSRNIVVSWLLPTQQESGPVDKYIVQYKNSEDETWVNSEEREVNMGGEPTIQLRELIPSTTYLVRILAKNHLGASLPSEALQVTTKGEPPSASPLTVRADALSSTSIRVTWNPPPANTHHGVLLGYNVGIKSQRLDSSTDYNFTVVGANSRQELLERLKPFSHYVIVVRAYNSQGSGPLSPPAIVQTFQDVPSQPPVDVDCLGGGSTATSLRIRWNPPPKEAINGLLQGYKLSFSIISDEDDLLNETTRSPVSSNELVTGLRAWTNYSVSVAAVSQAGIGVMSSELICTTREDIPGPPQLRALQSGSDMVLLTWLPPDPPTGVLLGYTIHHRGPHDNVPQQFPLPPYTTSYTAKRLALGSHKFWINARTHIGEGNPSTTFKITLTNVAPIGIASWGRRVVTQKGEDVRMECVVVGDQPPLPVWTKNGQRLANSQRIVLEEDGSLILKKVDKEDSGNYSCSLDTRRGRALNVVQAFTTVTSTVLVQVSPSAPRIRISDSTPSSITVNWTGGDSGGAPVRAWNVWWRLFSGSGTWNAMEVGRTHSKYVIRDLECGSEYQVYVTSKTKVGISPPSDPVTVQTRGSVPVSPPPHQVASANSSNIRVWMGRWEDGGCPISHFTLEIRHTGESTWTTLASNLAPQETYDFGHRGDAEIGLKLIAHNAVGATTATIHVGGPAGARVVENISQDESLTPLLFRDPRMLASAAASALALVLTIAAFVLCIRRKALAERASNADLKKCEDEQDGRETKMNLLKQRDNYATIIKQHPSSGLDRIPEYSEDIYPYATFQLGDGCGYQDSKEASTKFQTFVYQDSKYGITEGRPPISSSGSRKGEYAKVGVVRGGAGRGRRHRAGLRSESEEYDSDSETEMIISSRTESSNQLDCSTLTSENMHHMLPLDSSRLGSLRMKELDHNQPYLEEISECHGVDFPVESRHNKNVHHNIIYHTTESSCTSTEPSPTVDHKSLPQKSEGKKMTQNLEHVRKCQIQETSLTFPHHRERSSMGGLVGNKKAKHSYGKGLSPSESEDGKSVNLKDLKNVKKTKEVTEKHKSGFTEQLSSHFRAYSSSKTPKDYSIKV